MSIVDSDLDALEDWAKRQEWAMISVPADLAQDVLAVIQRLRDAEARIGYGELQVDYLKTRIARLERVCAGLLDCHTYLGSKAGSADGGTGCSKYQAGRAALAAVEANSNGA